MIQTETIAFFRELALHNRKEWFDQHRSRWEAAKQDYLRFIENLLPKLASVDLIQRKELHKYVSRINRDTRFSVDKSPYKKFIYATIERGDLAFGSVPFYVHFEPGNSFVGTGLWDPTAIQLKQVRQEIDYRFVDWQQVCTDPSFVRTFGCIEGQRLQRPPAGYSAEHPAQQWINMKQWIIRHPITDEQIQAADVIEYIKHVYILAMPFMQFLDQALAEPTDN